jgi:hypothetical protein
VSCIRVDAYKIPRGSYVEVKKEATMRIMQSKNRVWPGFFPYVMKKQAFGRILRGERYTALGEGRPPLIPPKCMYVGSLIGAWSKKSVSAWLEKSMVKKVRLSIAGRGAWSKK